MEYQVWILGYNADNTVNDFEQLEASFPEKDKAIWFAENYDFSKPTITDKAVVVVEKVDIDEDGNESCEDILLEREL